MQLELLVSLVVTLALGSVAHAQIAPTDGAPGFTAPTRDVSGTYTSTFGLLVLHQNGTQVVGNYELNDGQINGTFDGTTLRFTWRETSSAGFGVFVLGPDGGLDGTWGVNDDHSAGAWQATPASASTTTDLAASPFGDARLHAGSWSRELYMPWDGTAAAGSGWVGMGGLGVGVGKRLTDSEYLGVTADDEMMMALGDDGHDLNRLRAGLEARYTFGQGTGAGTVNDGPAFAVPFYYWVGARAGAESLDEGTTLGAYADLSLGADFALGQFQMGMYVSGGVSVEPTRAYGLPTTTSDTGIAASIAPSTDDPSSLGVYITMGLRVALG